MNNSQTVNEYVPDYLVTPGEVLEEYLDHIGITQASLAERTGLSKKTINEIVKAKSAITAETALRFERTLGRPAHFWSNLERQYQEDKTRLADKIRLEEDLHWLDLFPIKEMAKLGWIEKPKEKVQQLVVLLRFFAVASPEQWETIWTRELQAAFRNKISSPKDMAVISAWLRKGEIIAQEQYCAHPAGAAKFDRQKFNNCLAEIRKLTIEGSEIFVPKLQSICAAAGVVVIFIPALPKLGTYGATRRLGDKYIMQLSLYGKTNDELWFTIFHEAFHIINDPHGEQNTEEKADVFAQDILIPPDELAHFFLSNFKPTLQQIETFAARIGIAPGIIVGRLQHDGIIPRNVGNGLKARYEWVKG